MKLYNYPYTPKTSINLVNLAFGISYLQEQQANVSLKPSSPQLPLSSWLLAFTRSLSLQEREGEQTAWSTDIHRNSAMLERERERERVTRTAPSRHLPLSPHIALRQPKGLSIL